MTKDIKNENNQKNRQWKKHKKHPSSENKEKFSKSRNKLKNLTCNLYMSFKSKLVDKAKTNTKKFWWHVPSQDHDRQGIRKLVTEEGEEITKSTSLQTQ